MDTDKEGSRFKGGFEEPYCSKTCFDKAGEELLAIHWFVRRQGICGFCQKPVDSLSVRVVFSFRGQLLYVCENCVPNGKRFVTLSEA
jgi:hypothetical protein